MISKSLQKLVWRNSKCDTFPIEFLQLPQLDRNSIDLEDSDMGLPDPPSAKVFAGAFEDPEMNQIAQSMLAFNAAVKKMHTDEDDGLAEYVLIECQPATEENSCSIGG